MTSRRQIALLTLCGMLVGILADVASDGVDLSPKNIVLSVVMAPLLAMIGGKAVSAAPNAFFVGGLLFWPIWFFLARRWLKPERPLWLAALILGWSVQGFFQLVHRLALVMSA